eukprot:SAG11_NODE_42161_length_184_cov_31.235294_1_plen_26_part_01
MDNAKTEYFVGLQYSQDMSAAQMVCS